MRLAPKLDLLVLLLIVLAMNTALLSGSTPIAYDTFASFQEFAITYQSVFFHGGMPLWLPHTSYGTPYMLWLAYLSIVNLLFVGIGKLLQEQNVLVLFRVSLVFEQLISVVGMYLLGSRIFQKKITVALTCLAWMASFAVYTQILLNFRMVYLLPLVLFWIVLFFQKKSAVHLWLAGITMVLSVPGSTFYPLVIESYAIAIFTAVLFLSDRKAAGAILKPSRSNLAGFAAFLLIAAVFAYFYLTMQDGIDLGRSGRNPDFTVPIPVFLTEGKFWSPLDLLGTLLFGAVSLENTDLYQHVLYIGLIPLAGVVAAIFFQRRPIWYATLAAAIFLYLFSLGGYAARAAYYLPLVDLNRYVGPLGTVPFRAFLIIGAGLGLDLSLSAGRWRRVGAGILGLAILVNIARATIPGAVAPAPPESLQSARAAFGGDAGSLLLRLGLMALLALAALLLHRRILRDDRQRPEWLTSAAVTNGFLLLFAVIDLGVYRVDFENQVHAYLEKPDKPALTLPRFGPLAYQAERLRLPADATTRNAMESAYAIQSSPAHDIESYLQFDRCIPEAFISSGAFEVVSSSLTGLIKHGLVLAPYETGPMRLRQLYGCEFPKLRVVVNVYAAPSNKLAWSALLKTEDFSNLLVLGAQDSGQQTVLDRPVPESELQVIAFSPNEVRLDVDLRDEAGWLVYSDAYNPEWKATVNGRPTHIKLAYMAFKAVPITKGMNHVVLSYGAPMRHVMYNLLAVLGGAGGLLLSGGLVFTLLFDRSRTGST